MKSQLLNFHDVVLVLTIAEAVLLAIIIRTLPSQRKLSGMLLSYLLLLLGGVLACNIFLWSEGLEGSLVKESMISSLGITLCTLGQGPLLLFYLRSLKPDFRIQAWPHALHLIPMAVVAMAIVSLDLTGSRLIPAPDQTGYSSPVSVWLWGFMKCGLLFYVGACFWWGLHHRRSLPTTDNIFRIWEQRLAFVVLVGFMIHWSWTSFTYLGEKLFEFSPPVNDVLGIMNNYLAVILVNALFAFGVIHTRNATLTLVKKSTRQLSPEKHEPIVQAIEIAMEEQKLYLKSDINLERFCDVIGFSPREVSNVINSRFKVNFFEFINRYRVEEAKRLLASSEHQNKTILDIIYMSGFNSQSAFHRFFKRFANMTPSQYRKSQKLAA